jgi:hypothetical protein
MADRKISDLTALTTPAAGDYLPIVDISEASAANKNKRITIEELLRGAPDGTAAAPSIAFESDGGNGLYLAGTDTIGVSTNGVNRLTLSTTAFTSTLPISATSFSPTSATVPTNGVYLPAANSVAISTNGTGRLFVDASGNVGVGGSPSTTLHLAGNPVAQTVRINSSTSAGFVGTTGYITQIAANRNPVDGSIVNTGTATAYINLEADVSNGNIQFCTTGSNNTGATERARIDSSGRLLVGTSTEQGTNILQIQQSAGAFLSLRRNEAATAITAGEDLGGIEFQDNGGGVYATILGEADGTAGSGDYPGRLVFSTTADGASSPTERMRITSGGNVFVGNTTGDYNTVGVSAFSDGNLQAVTNNRSTLVVNRKGSDGVIVDFYRDTNNPGTISVTTTATAYNTSSDYRLKENVIAVTDGITRLQQLKPSRFNFIVDPSKTVDGFLAHEVQSVVPEAITGEKDAVDDDGNPVYQGIDQSKLVPLLTAALQEAVAKIESLEARLTAAGI